MAAAPRKTFRDPQVQALFERQGYVKLPFAERAELDAAWAKIRSLEPSDSFASGQEMDIPSQSYHCTFFDKNRGYRSRVFEILSDFFAPAIQSHFIDHTPIQANVFLKPPGQGFVYPHQNLTVTDESRFSSLSLWCPFQDTRAENGTMFVVPGSHRKFMKWRSTHIYWPLMRMFMEPVGLKYMEEIEVRAGELLLIDDSIIHYTPDNHSASPRIVFHGMVAPREAPVWYCQLDEAGKKVEVYETERDFWQYYLPGGRPSGLKLVQELDYVEQAMEEADFRAELMA